MKTSLTRYRLFTESAVDQRDGWGWEAHPKGHWRFTLESLHDGRLLEASGEENEADADRLALLAIVRGLEALDQPALVRLFTRSRYISHGLRFGLEQWRENDWHWERFGEMVPITNADLWQRVDHALRYHRVECRTWRIDDSRAGVPVPKMASLRRRQRGTGASRRTPRGTRQGNVQDTWAGGVRGLHPEGPGRWSVPVRSKVGAQVAWKAWQDHSDYHIRDFLATRHLPTDGT